jgi:hypothetical protein
MIKIRNERQRKVVRIIFHTPEIWREVFIGIAINGVNYT